MKIKIIYGFPEQVEKEVNAFLNGWGERIKKISFLETSNDQYLQVIAVIEYEEKKW